MADVQVQVHEIEFRHVDTHQPLDPSGILEHRPDLAELEPGQWDYIYNLTGDAIPIERVDPYAVIYKCEDGEDPYPVGHLSPDESTPARR
jgi:hypothetical protein